jgi:hypothetical protein
MRELREEKDSPFTGWNGALIFLMFFFFFRTSKPPTKINGSVGLRNEVCSALPDGGEEERV